MNLNDFTITNHQISFHNPYYANLENLLNNDFYKLSALDGCLNELLYLKNNWTNVQIRDAYIEIKLGGYWDWEGLDARKISGNWFTVIIAFDDLNGYVNRDTQMFYLENEILIQKPIIQMPLDEFIDILQQWKHILNEQ